MYKNKYLIFITAFYITIKLAAFITTYKVTDFQIFSACFSVLIIPLWFLTGDVIAEVYGYKIAKQLVILAIICQMIMILIGYISSKTLSPQIFTHQSQIYKEIFSSLTVGAITNSIGILIGGLVNARIILFLKATFKGKYFVGRCLIANGVGEFVFTIIAYSTGILETTPIYTIFKLMLASYTVKLVVSPLLLFPAAIISKKLKLLEETMPSNQTVSYGISKKSTNNQSAIVNLAEDSNGKSYFTKYMLKMPVVHELGKFSDDYEHTVVKFAEFNSGVHIGFYNLKNPQFFICISGIFKITASDGTHQIFKDGSIILFNDLTGDGHSFEVLSKCTIAIVDLL